MDETSPIAVALKALVTVNPSWQVDIGRPEGDGWIAGVELVDASSGPFNDLLVRIGRRANTTDRRTIAASFALRFGWASMAAIAPYLRNACVPDVTLGNCSFRFKQSTFFERMAVYEPRGFLVRDDARALHSLVSSVPDRGELLQTLRDGLVAQATPVVDALYAWSGFAPKGTWGMLTSSWVSHVTGLWSTADDQRAALPMIDAFFAGDDIVSLARPRLHAVGWEGVTHVFQRRASCCRYYLLPQGHLCTSCPLVPHDERLARNREWMRTQHERRRVTGGHA